MLVFQKCRFDIEASKGVESLGFRDNPTAAKNQYAIVITHATPSELYVLWVVLFLMCKIEYLHHSVDNSLAAARQIVGRTVGRLEDQADKLKCIKVCVLEGVENERRSERLEESCLPRDRAVRAR